MKSSEIAKHYSNSDSPQNLSIGDLDGDGKPDIIVAKKNDSSRASKTDVDTKNLFSGVYKIVSNDNKSSKTKTVVILR
jgi:hypothetical protein